MLSATNLSRLPEVRWLLGLCFAGALSGCAVEYAEGDEGTLGQLNEPSLSNWIDLGGAVTDVAVSYLSDSTPDIWGIGLNGQVHSRTNTSDWILSAGKPSSVSALTGVAAGRRGSKTDVVATDTSGRIWTTTRTGTNTWGTWVTVGAVPGTAKDKPAVSTVTGSDRLDVWVRGLNDSLYHAWRFGSGAWSSWTNVGGPSGGMGGPPSAYTRSASPLIIDVAAHDKLGQVYVRTWNIDHWLDWSFAQASGGDPSVASTPSGLSLTFFLPQGFPSVVKINQMYYKPGSGWLLNDTFAPMPTGGVTGRMAAIFRNNINFDFYIIGNSQNLWRRTPK